MFYIEKFKKMLSGGLEVLFSISLVYLPILLNPITRRVQGHQVLGLVFFFFFLNYCAMLVVLVVSERRAVLQYPS